MQFQLANGTLEQFTSDLSVRLGDRTLDYQRDDFQLLSGGETTTLVIGAERFPWATAERTHIHLRLALGSRILWDDVIELARRPALNVGHSPWITEISSTENASVGLRIIRQRIGVSRGALYAVGSGRISIELPPEVLQYPARFTLELEGGVLNTQTAENGWVELPRLPHEHVESGMPATLQLSYRGKVVSQAGFIRFLEPLREPQYGDPWTPPRSAAKWWDYNVDRPDVVRASAAVSVGPPGFQGFHRLTFEHLRLQVQPGLYIIEMTTRNIGAGSLSIPFTPFYEALVPRGYGLRRSSMKLAGPFACSPDDREYLTLQGAIYRFASPDSELILPPWPPQLTPLNKPSPYPHAPCQHYGGWPRIRSDCEVRALHRRP